MGKRIDFYFDLASLYSYFAFLYLLNDLDNLKAHGVKIEFHPAWLPAVGAAKGNDKPPWVIPAKLQHGLFDWWRSAEKAGIELSLPKRVKGPSNTATPMRALTYIKANYPPETFQKAFHYMFHRRWSPPTIDLGAPGGLAEALTEAPEDFNGPDGSYANSKRLFLEEEVSKIVEAANSQEMKDRLRQAVQEVGDKGAYGLPWLWVRNDAGEEEPFFGGDRFHFVYKFLGLPYQDVVLLPPGEAQNSAKL